MAKKREEQKEVDAYIKEQLLIYERLCLHRAEQLFLLRTSQHPYFQISDREQRQSR